MEGWRDGEMEGWRDGGMEGWRDGETERWRSRGYTPKGIPALSLTCTGGGNGMFLMFISPFFASANPFSWKYCSMMWWDLNINPGKSTRKNPAYFFPSLPLPASTYLFWTPQSGLPFPSRTLEKQQDFPKNPAKSLIRQSQPML
jgi:hypothetical protein